MPMGKILILLLFLVMVPKCIGTNFTNYGTNFYFGLTKNYNNQNDFLGLAIFAVNHNVSVTIKIPWSRSTVNTYISSPKYIDIVNITNITKVSESSNYDNRNRSIHVSSDQPIAVIALNWLSGSLGEYLVLPCHDYNIIRYEYYAVTPRSAGWSSQVLLVGCENYTNIIITPSEAVYLPSDTQSSTDQLISVPKGTPHHVVLHQGQTLYFGAPLIDLTGTHIVSNKPLTVISGHQCGQVPLGVNYCEHMTQQIPPTITWGKQFLLVPFEYRQSGQYTKLVTSQDHTTITISCNGSTTNVVFINSKGGKYTLFFGSSQYCHIQANKPIIVVLFATGSSLDNNFGDPIMILVPPIEQYSCRFDFPVFINIYFVGISITTSPEDFSPNSILLDGVPLTNWVTILNSSMDIVGYGTKIATTANTVHTVLHTGNGTLSVLLYGFKRHRGYGLLVGMTLMPINKGAIIKCYSSCVHGICEIVNNTYTCDCFQGWTGSNCDQVPRCIGTNFTNYGTDFYFGLMKNYNSQRDFLGLAISTVNHNVSVTIKIPWSGSTVNKLISSLNDINIVNLTNITNVSESSNYDNRNRSIHVSSNQPIAVIALNWLSGSSGEYLVLPCHDYNINRYEYYAVTPRSAGWSSQVLLVGCENDTNIIITPSEAVSLPSDTQSSTDQLISVPKGTPHHVVLHQGQTLYFGAPLIDLTGTHIVSNKPLTVISGHQCGQVPLGVNYCEHMTQQIPPTITWGKQFLLVPFEHRQSGQYTKLVTSQDHTTITISCNGSTTNVVFINSKGGKYTLFFGSSQYCHIQANKPIIVVLFATGSSLDNNFGDPIMILVPPIEQYSCRFDFPVFINIYFVGISITTSPEDFSPNSILLDGVPLTNWVTILNSSMDIVGYGTKIATTANTVHTVLHTGNGTLSVLLYGFKRHRGYGLLVGMTLMPINKGAIIKCYSSCVHGICEIVNNTYTCDCFQGWTGSNCDQVPRCIGTNFTNYGTDFYFGLMKNYNSQRDFLGLAISTVNHNVSVTIKIPWSGSTVNKLISSLNDINIVNLTNITNVSESSNYDNRNRSIHVSSNQPISVIALNWLSGSSGEYLVLPCHDYNINRYEYYAVTPRSTGWSSQVLLVGCENDTNIIITPSEAVSLPSDTQSSTDQFVNIPNGTSHHIVLHQGQTLYFGAPLIDLTGTHIVSNKPLTVISGHQCGQVPLGVGYCEHMTQQIPPTITWGKQFLLVPFEHRQSGQYTKLVTSQDHTTITISCNGSKTNAVIINNKGGNYTFFFSSSQYCHIQANKPIIVVLFATGGSLDNNIGDPIMILVPPIEQYSCRFDFPVFINIDFVGISITTSPEDFSPKSILLDGVPLTNWVTILNSSMDIVGYGTKIATTSNTVHTVLHTGNGTLSVLLYGFKWGHGYGLLVGMMLMPINKGECYSSCVHGICEIINNTYTCDCFYGWTGSNCDQDKLSAISVVISVVTVLVFVLLVVFIAIVVMTVRNKFLKRQLEINQQNELELNIYGELNNINYNKSPKSVGEQDDQFKKKLAEIPPEPMYDNIDELSIEEESEDFHQQSCYLLFKK